MSKVTNDGLTRLAQDALQLYPYGNSGRQRVTKTTILTTLIRMIFINAVDLLMWLACVVEPCCNDRQVGRTNIETTATHRRCLEQGHYQRSGIRTIAQDTSQSWERATVA